MKSFEENFRWSNLLVWMFNKHVFEDIQFDTKCRVCHFKEWTRSFQHNCHTNPMTVVLKADPFICRCTSRSNNYFLSLTTYISHFIDTMSVNLNVYWTPKIVSKLVSCSRNSLLGRSKDTCVHNMLIEVSNNHYQYFLRFFFKSSIYFQCSLHILPLAFLW